jgi:hypothetical protein
MQISFAGQVLRHTVKSTVLFILLLAGGAEAYCQTQTAPLPEVRYPQTDVELQSMAAKAKAESAAKSQFKVPYQFHFTDELQQSGVTFVNHVTIYGKQLYRPVHYDHGTGVAVADVDGDGLYDIYFVSQIGGNELWKNLSGGKFENITQSAGVAVPGRVSVGAAFADVNNSGHQDLFVTTVMGGNLLFKNDGHGHFEDITKSAGLDLKAHSSGAFFFDYNNDGRVDLLVCNVGKYTTDQKGPDGAYVGLKDAFYGHLHPERYEHPVLYQNMGDYHFKDVTQQVHLDPHGWCGDATFTDFNGSGWPSVFFLNMQGADQYFENEKGQQFVDKTKEHFSKTPWGAMGIKFFDYNNDGRMDLILTDMHSDMMDTLTPFHEKEKIAKPAPETFLGAPASNFIFGNAFYRNMGAGKFEEASDRLGVETYWPWGVSVGDVNADGWDDIFITAGMNFPFHYGINSLLLNNRGEKFLDSEFLLGIEPRKHPYTPWFSINCANPDPVNDVTETACAGYGDQTVELMAPKGSRSSVIFDLDNDGDLDIVTNDFNSAPQIFISDLAQKKTIHWLKVLLQGTASNRNGLGATVRLYSGDQVFTKYNDGKSGYLSQSVLPLYFGLGELPKIDKIEVKWPSGKDQVVTKDLQENQTLQIVEPK